jgi:hypothetical protein
MEHGPRHYSDHSLPKMLVERIKTMQVLRMERTLTNWLMVAMKKEKKKKRRLQLMRRKKAMSQNQNLSL